MYKCTRCNWFGDKGETIKLSPLAYRTCPKCAGSVDYIPLESDREVKSREFNGF